MKVLADDNLTGEHNEYLTGRFETDHPEARYLAPALVIKEWSHNAAITQKWWRRLNCEVIEFDEGERSIFEVWLRQ